MDLSLVIPLLNEDESLPELATWIDRVCIAHGITYEIIFIDDGSTDQSWKVIQELRSEIPSIKGVRFRRNYGKSAALNVGFGLTAGNVVITMDADLQDSPDEIPELMRLITEEGYDLVSGWKKKRHDPLTKTIPTKLFNWATRRISDIKLHDFNCGLKSYRGEVVRNIEVYGEMHRYIPFLAKNAGFSKITEKVVQHQERKYGKTKFGLDRFINGYLDLLSLYFISRFGKRPMHFFGLLGSMMFFIGFLSSAWIGGYKLWALSQHMKPGLVTENPWFYIALTTMVIGSLLFLTGFVAEMVHQNNGDRNNYNVSEKAGW